MYNKKYSFHNYGKLFYSLVREIIGDAEKKKNRGYFGDYGGQYVPEVLYNPLSELTEGFFSLKNNKEFWENYTDVLLHYVGRPTPLYEAKNISEHIQLHTAKNNRSGANIYIKLEGLAHTGAHKINNALGQGLLAKKLGKTRIIAETGAGQHGVATATACAKLGIKCVVYMGSLDYRRQRPNVHIMKMLGAEVISVDSGQQTLKDAINEAMRDWAKNFSNTHYLIGSALGPAPYPTMVQCFQSVIGMELVLQCMERDIHPHGLVACVGGGSNAIGMFTPFILENDVLGVKDFFNPRLHVAEAGGRGLQYGQHATRLNKIKSVKTAVAHGYKSKFLVNTDGQLGKTHSISAGLDYPGIGPIFSHLSDKNRISHSNITDKKALQAFELFTRKEGLLFALESAHAAAAAVEISSQMKKNQNLIINMSGRGDKDLFITAPEFNKEGWIGFLKDEIKRLETK